MPYSISPKRERNYTFKLVESEDKLLALSDRDSLNLKVPLSLLSHQRRCTI